MEVHTDAPSLALRLRLVGINEQRCMDPLQRGALQGKRNPCPAALSKPGRPGLEELEEAASKERKGEAAQISVRIPQETERGRWVR